MPSHKPDAFGAPVVSESYVSLLQQLHSVYLNTAQALLANLQRRASNPTEEVRGYAAAVPSVEHTETAELRAQVEVEIKRLQRVGGALEQLWTLARPYLPPTAPPGR